MTANRLHTYPEIPDKKDLSLQYRSYICEAFAHPGSGGSWERCGECGRIEQTALCTPVERADFLPRRSKYYFVCVVTGPAESACATYRSVDLVRVWFRRPMEAACGALKKKE